MFAARQIANNLSPIAKNFYLIFLALCIMSFERTSNNLACALQFFLCLFCARFALLKTGLSNRNLTKKNLKIELFLQKRKNFFFQRPLSEVTNYNTSPMPSIILCACFNFQCCVATSFYCCTSYFCAISIRY